MTPTKIQIDCVHVGSMEQETQVVIDALQAKGWNVVWGTGPNQFCSDDEERAFWKDFEKVIMVLVFAKVHWGIVP